MTKDSMFSLKSYVELDHFTFSNWYDSISGNFNNVIQISDDVSYEKMRNKEWDHSKVTVVYPK